MSTQHEATGLLSEEQREQWDRDGYMVIEDPGAPDSVLDGVFDDLDGLFEDEGRTRTDERGVFYTYHRIMDAWKLSENVRTIATLPKVLGILEELMDRRPFPFQTLNFPRGTEQDVHSDAIHFNSVPSGYMCGVWIALEDMDMDNGPLVYYPGSHKLPEVAMQTVGVKPDKSEYIHYTDYIADLIKEEGLQPSYALVEKGQAFVWAGNLLHGGSPQRDRTRTRKSQVTHYFFEGCRYYTPLASGPDDVRWRDPEWITAPGE